MTRVNHLFLSRNSLGSWKTSGKKCFSLVVFPFQKNFTLISSLILIAFHLCAFKWIIISVNRTVCLNIFGSPAAGVSRDAWRISGRHSPGVIGDGASTAPGAGCTGRKHPQAAWCSCTRCSHGFLALPVLCTKKPKKSQRADVTKWMPLWNKFSYLRKNYWQLNFADINQRTSYYSGKYVYANIARGQKRDFIIRMNYFPRNPQLTLLPHITAIHVFPIR